jgi:FAS-associated factor 2
LDRAKRELKSLLVVLHSEDHADTDKFCRETLTSPVFINYCNEKEVMVWAGSVKESEPYKLSSTLNATQYPFMAYIVLHEGRMKVVHRFEGVQTPQHCTEVMDKLMAKMLPFYREAKAERYDALN